MHTKNLHAYQSLSFYHILGIVALHLLAVVPITGMSWTALCVPVMLEGKLGFAK